MCEFLPNGYRFAGVCAFAEIAPLSSHAPPGTSGFAPLDTPCHNWSQETVNINKTKAPNFHLIFTQKRLKSLVSSAVQSYSESTD